MRAGSGIGWVEGVSILCYHAVDPAWESRLSVPPQLFAKQCEWLKRHRKVLALTDAAPRARVSGALPRGMTAMSFDDGMSSLYDHAWPALTRYGIPATIFLVAQTLTAEGKKVDWVDHPPPGGLATLSREQILEMQESGVAFGSHSLSHRDLVDLGDEECRQDLARSKEILEDVLGKRVTMLAYPRGLHDERVHIAARRAGFEFGFGTSKPVRPQGPLSIPRIGVYPGNRISSLWIKTSPLYPPLRTGVRLAAAKQAVRSIGRLR